MGKSKFSDTLLEFHLHNPRVSVHALISNLVNILQGDGSPNLDAKWEDISNTISENDAERILQFACKKAEVDYANLVKEAKSQIHHISLRLLLRMIAFPLSYVAGKLQIDQFRAAQLLDQLRTSLIIDDPLTWLKDLEYYCEQERQVYELEKSAESHGVQLTHQPADTAQERKERKRRLGELRPHIDPI